jgi:hypothetical protein
MAVFVVVDASVTLAWCFEDEPKTPRSEGPLERLKHGDRIVVPAHWPTEVGNGLLMAVRKKRIKPEQPPLLWDELGHLPINPEPASQLIKSKRFLHWAKSIDSLYTTQHIWNSPAAANSHWEPSMAICVKQHRLRAWNCSKTKAKRP